MGLGQQIRKEQVPASYCFNTFSCYVVFFPLVIMLFRARLVALALALLTRPGDCYTCGWLVADGLDPRRFEAPKTMFKKAS